MCVVAVRLATLVAVASSLVLSCHAQVWARPPDFFDGAPIVSVPPGDLTGNFLSLPRDNSKHVFQLAAGTYTMPPHNAQINLTANVQFRGVGVNQTFLAWKGRQHVLSLLPGSSFEAANVTLTGGTQGTFAAQPGSDTRIGSVTNMRFIDAEWWMACDDLDVTHTSTVPAAGCPAGAAMDGTCKMAFLPSMFRRVLYSGSLTYINGLDEDVEYTNQTITYAKGLGPFVLKSTDSLGGNANIYYDGVVVRTAHAIPDMSNLFDEIVARNPDVSGQQDCFTLNDGDYGFTYRGNAAKSKDGLPCLAWDDSQIPFNTYFPNPDGQFSSVEANFCRNPRLQNLLTPGPWCFVIGYDGLITPRSCGVRECSAPSIHESHGSHLSAGAVAGIVLASLAAWTMAIGICIALWCIKHKKREAERQQQELERLAALEELERLRQAEAAKKAKELHDGGLRDWHVRTYFESTEPEPPVREDSATADAAQAWQKVPVGVDPKQARQRRLIHEMLSSGVPIDSLAPEDLQYKYGEWWNRHNILDTTKFIGAGAITQVYAGTHCNKPAAFKVLNKMRPAEAMLRFIRKSVLPGIFFQRHPNFPLHHPHLLPLIECVMFPPWYTLLEMAKESEAFTQQQRDGFVRAPVSVIALREDDEYSQTSKVSTAPSRDARSRSTLGVSAPPHDIPRPLPSRPASDAATTPVAAGSTPHENEHVFTFMRQESGVDESADQGPPTNPGLVFSFSSSLCQTSPTPSEAGGLDSFCPSRVDLRYRRHGTSGVTSSSGPVEVPALSFASASAAARRGTLRSYRESLPPEMRPFSLPQDLKNLFRPKTPSPSSNGEAALKAPQPLRKDPLDAQPLLHIESRRPRRPMAAAFTTSLEDDDEDDDLSLHHPTIRPPGPIAEGLADASDVAIPIAPASSSREQLALQVATPPPGPVAEGRWFARLAENKRDTPPSTFSASKSYETTTPTSYTTCMAQLGESGQRPLRAQRDLVCQIIMVSSLCELGTLSTLLNNRKRLPVECLPLSMREEMQREGLLGPITMDVDVEEHAGARHGPTSRQALLVEQAVLSERDTVLFAELPSLWQAIFKLQLSLQVIAGVSALHAASLIHCDIKPDNIFIKQDSSFHPFGVCAKIGDLDTCRSLIGNDGLMARFNLGYKDEHVFEEDNLGIGNSAHTMYTSNMKGTPGFLSPEMISEGRIAPTTDVYSTAVTLAIVLSKSHRFLKYDELHVKVIPDFMDELDPEVGKILAECLQPDPSLRPTLGELRKIVTTQFQKCVRMAQGQGHFIFC